MDLMTPFITGFMNIGSSIFNNEMQRQRTAEDRWENYNYGEMAAQNADARTRALYNDFYSPQALLKQYEKAGLSPSMMFGGTPGQGGMSGAQGTGAGGPTTPYMPISLVEAAQAASLFAQADKTKEETKTIKETREPTVQNLFADLNQKFAETNNKEAQTSLLKFQTTYQEITNKWADKNYEINLKVAAAQSEVLENQSTLLLYQTLHEMSEAEVSQMTKEARIKNMELQNQDLTKDILLKNSSIKFTEAQTDVLIKDIENKTMLAHAEYIEHMAGSSAKYSQADFMQRSEKFFDDQIDMWLSDFEKDFYKFGEELKIEKSKLDLEYKKLKETIRHNKATEWNMGFMGLTMFNKQ